MTQKENALIDAAVRMICDLFKNDFSGHDHFHTLRVYKTAVALAEQEQADMLTVSLAALLHDADDRKLSPETYAEKTRAVTFLRSQGVPEEQIRAIVRIIGEVSFVGTDSVAPSTIEGCCVQDADRLDALGAVGIARTFAYGGSHHRPLYDPAEQPLLGMDEAAYRSHTSCSVNHFYEKLFLLKDMMNTAAGKALAIKREAYIRAFLDEFMLEWDGQDLGSAL